MNSPHPSRRDLLRLATLIHRQLDESRPVVPGPIPEHDWQRLVTLQRWLELAHQRGWTRALSRLERQHVSLVRTLTHHLAARQQIFDERRDRRPVASLRDILADLAALDAEFEGLPIHLKEKTFSVVTPPIVLEGVELGRFQITVQIECLGESSPYEVFALDPNPAADSSNVVHPHVQEDSLCEGEGRAAIRRASAEGRVFDLCLIVHQILQTYHSGSAYVPLSRWNGRECRDCGTRSSDDESTSCRRCDNDLCLDCADSCGACQESVCAECRSRCVACDSAVCDSCLRSCVSCGEGHCRDCLSTAECDTCLASSETLPEETDDDKATLEGTPERTPQSATTADLAIHAVGLGQVSVPA